MVERRSAGEAAPTTVSAVSPAIAAPAATALVVIAAFYFGRDILIPLALATLLAFALSPLVSILRRIWIPRIAAIGIAVLVAVAVVVGITAAVSIQLAQLATNLPKYQRNITAKIESLRPGDADNSIVNRISAALRGFERQFVPPPSPQGQTPADGQAARAPVPVVVQSPPLSAWQIMQAVLQPLVGPLGTAGLVVIFVLFILLEREQLRDRFIRLFGGDDLQRSTQLITDAANRVSRYLLAQLLVNVSYGFPVGVGLALIGVPNAILWGVLATVLRFIPYIGPWLAALFPLLIAMGSEPGWSMLLWVGGLFLVMELISNNVVEPWLYGASTGLSSFAVILAAIFWTSLWGPIGLLLSTPLTVCLVVIGRHVPRLEFLDILLGNQPVLSPAERLYQRLLAGDLNEALDIAEAEIKASSPDAFYQAVALEALRLAERDRSRGSDAALRRTLVSTFGELVDSLTEDDSPPRPDAPRVLCIAGRTDLDFASATALAARLAAHGIRAEARGHMTLAPDSIAGLELDQFTRVCLCYLGTRPDRAVRMAYRRLKPSLGDTQLALCLFNGGAGLDRERLAGEGATSPAILTDFTKAVAELAGLAEGDANRGAAHQDDQVRPEGADATAPRSDHERTKAAPKKTI